MYVLMALLFVAGYLCIAFEHPLKIDKAASALLTAVLCWTVLALGADCTMIGRAFIYALAAQGGAGVTHLLQLLEKEMRVAMTLTSVKNVAEITGNLLVQER